jgi:class 3 adenylate cyclase
MSLEAVTTVLFTDIADSSARAAQLGDARWAQLLASHTAIVRIELDRFSGRERWHEVLGRQPDEVDNADDGFLMTFDNAQNAVSCALSVSRKSRDLGLEIRAGIHAGECVFLGTKVAGFPVHAAARIAAIARPGEVLLSDNVRLLLGKRRIALAERGTYQLKGIPGDWRLYSPA